MKNVANAGIRVKLSVTCLYFNFYKCIIYLVRNNNYSDIYIKSTTK